LFMNFVFPFLFFLWSKRFGHKIFLWGVKIQKSATPAQAEEDG